MIQFSARIKQTYKRSRMQAIDLVYDTLDTLLLDRKFDDVNVLLSEMLKENLPMSILMSARCVCHPWRSHVPVYSELCVKTGMDV